MSVAITIRVNQPMLGFYKGQVITLGRGHIPLDKFWLGRIKDSAIDGCVTVLDDEITPDTEPKKPVNKSKTKVRKSHGNK